MPDTDSIDELAVFWDTHDLTDFHDQLEEVRRPTFVRDEKTTLAISLKRREAEALTRVARSEGVHPAGWCRTGFARNSAAPAHSGRRASESDGRVLALDSAGLSRSSLGLCDVSGGVRQRAGISEAWPRGASSESARSGTSPLRATC